MSQGDHPPPHEFSLLTPAGMGAVATFGWRGPGVARELRRWFSPARAHALHELPAGRSVFGHWGRATPDEAVVARLGPDRWELHVHGGAAVLERMRQDLRTAGAREVPWQDWLRDQPLDPLSIQAQIELVSAPTRRTAEILLDQSRGALRRELSEILALLHDQSIVAAQQRLATLLGRAPLGAHLVRPWQVVLAGRANAGKSSLANALAGFERAIVDAQPGTTRDLLTTPLAIDGWPVTLVDTAGLRAATEPLESAGIQLAHDAIAQADLILWVIDATAPALTPIEPTRLTAVARLVVYNKIDLSPPPATFSAAFPRGLGISARTGQGLDRLLTAIASSLVPEPPPPGAAIPFRPEQVACFEQVAAALTASDVKAAVTLLASWLEAHATPQPQGARPSTADSSRDD